MLYGDIPNFNIHMCFCKNEISISSIGSFHVKKTIFRTFQKLNQLGGGRGGRGVCEMFLLERRDKPEKMELMLKWGWSLFFTTFSSITFTFSDLQSFELAMQDFHPYSHSSLVLKPGIIFTFLIRSGSQQKMLIALFNLVRNTKKIIWTIFFECQGKVFLCIEKILDKISQDQT